MLNNRGVQAHKRAFDPTDVPEQALARLRTLARDGAQPAAVPPRILKHLQHAQLPSPCLIVDLEIIERHYRDLAGALPEAAVYYAVKANPAEAVLRRLAQLGSRFDTASTGEIDLCLSLGIDPALLSYGNTIKKQRDIAYAFAKGVRMFAFDSEAELVKLAESAPGAQVFCRILADCTGAEWPLSRKFGCETGMAAELLVRAKALGLDPCGVSFHAGSQQTDPRQFEKAIAQVADLFAEVARRGLTLRLVNAGGGFPSRYHREVPAIGAYARAIRSALSQHFPGAAPALAVEPGRYIVGDAGVIVSEVVLVAEKGGADRRRWVYLDIGKFHGLAETMDEAIRYRFVTPHDGGETAPAIVAGPTCDSADVLYEKTPCELPLALKAGDRVMILSTGAYTTTYSSVAFNGLPPLESVYI